jgi:hypothetical protein
MSTRRTAATSAYKRCKAAKKSATNGEQQQQQQLDSAGDSAVQISRYGVATTLAAAMIPQ